MNAAGITDYGVMGQTGPAIPGASPLLEFFFDGEAMLLALVIIVTALLVGAPSQS